MCFFLFFPFFFLFLVPNQTIKYHIWTTSVHVCLYFFNFYMPQGHSSSSFVFNIIRGFERIYWVRHLTYFFLTRAYFVNGNTYLMSDLTDN